MEPEFPAYSPKPGIRRDIFSFEENDYHRKRFFICLKMLGILDVHKENQDLQFNFNAKTKQESGSSQELADMANTLFCKPQRIHDEFISSHVTSCEHDTPYFNYYHRNMMIYLELQLNYADQYLRYHKWEDQKEHQN